MPSVVSVVLLDSSPTNRDRSAQSCQRFSRVYDIENPLAWVETDAALDVEQMV